MPLDMMIKGRHVSCNEFKGEVLYAPEEFGTFPFFERISDREYEDFELSPDEANTLLHELIAIRTLALEQYPEYKYLVRLIDRYLPLLSEAYRRREWVKCLGD